MFSIKKAVRSRSPLAMLVASAAVLGGGLMAGVSMAGTSKTAGSYDSAAIADKALSYWNGSHGGPGEKPRAPGAAACADARKPGDSGGQCRAFVNCIVYMVSNHTQVLGRVRNYFDDFVREGGRRISDINNVVKGDIVQIGSTGTHTTIVVGRVGPGQFMVVDSNHWGGDETVDEYVRAIPRLDDVTRAFRMGTVGGAAGQQPVAQIPTNNPVPPPPALKVVPLPPQPRVVVAPPAQQPNLVVEGPTRKPNTPAQPDVSQYAGHIVQWDGDTKAQRTAWLVGPDLKRRWIPDAATYNCLKANGAPGPDVLSSDKLDRLTDLTGQQASCSSQPAAQPPAPPARQPTTTAPTDAAPPDVSQYAGHIVQWDGDTKAQRTAWLVGPDLKRRWIPDAATYNCLKANGAPGPDVLSSDKLDRLTDLTGQQASCSSQPAAQSPAPPAPQPGPIFPVMNTSETPPDGVWFRNSAHTADTSRVTGLGVYAGESVQLTCYAFGDAVGPYNDTLWYRVSNVTRPNVNGQPNVGYLNAHYINDGKAANQVDGGVPAC